MIFGKRKPGMADMQMGMPASMPTAGTIQDNAGFGGGGATPNQRRPGYWMGGDKFTGRDALAGAMAAIGDGLQNWAGGQGGAVGGLIGNRAAVAQQEAARQQQAQLMAAAQAAGITPEQFALLGPEGLRQVTVQGMKPETPPAIQQNADYIRRTQGDAAADNYIRNFGQRPEEPRMVTLPDGRAIFGTMSEIQQLLGGGGAQPQVLGNTLPQGWIIQGGASGNAGGNFPR